MRGRRNPPASMLAFVDLDERVPPQHPLRSIKRFADRALTQLSPTFNATYGSGGRPSLPPERLLKASLLISLYSVRSERAFCEELDYQLLWRWFLDMSLMEPSFDQSTSSRQRGIGRPYVRPGRSPGAPADDIDRRRVAQPKRRGDGGRWRCALFEEQLSP